MLRAIVPLAAALLFAAQRTGSALPARAAAKTPGPLPARPTAHSISSSAIGTASALRLRYRSDSLFVGRIAFDSSRFGQPAMTHALIVDDDVDSAEMLATLLAGEGLTAATAHSLAEARRQIVLQTPDLILLDLNLPDGSGMTLFDNESVRANAEVVLVTGHASLETSIEALRLGAADYLIKPVNIRQLKGILSRVAKPAAVEAEISSMQADARESANFGQLRGRSAAMQRVYQQIGRVAPTAVSVLFTGESGTGKEVAARTVHDLSRRRDRPFLAVNCGAISPTLIESEMFGHEKGSFTGANRQHLGYFERANGGTLLLDEVTEMPLDLQVKLLRVLETGTFMRVGALETLHTDVRVIAATNRDPERAVADGRLREDLLYRLNIFPIEMPPLRERLEDVPLLAEFFLQQAIEREGEIKRLTPAVIAQFCSYSWPGNVRELRNAVYRSYVMAAGPEIQEAWLTVRGSGVIPNDVRAGETIEVAVGGPLAEAERLLILAALRKFGGHKERTAAALGISLKTLYNRMKEYAVETVAETRGDG
jgi:DNA-binding NtrC family response regulator